MSLLPKSKTIDDKRLQSWSERKSAARSGWWTGGGPFSIMATKAAFDEGGWRGELRNISDPKRPNVVGAAVYAQLGENDKAFESLEKAYERHAIRLVHIDREPQFDPIRNDPRFDALLKRIGLK